MPVVFLFRVQYYPMVMFLTTNKLSQVVLGNWCLVLTLAFGKLIRGIFLGPLRDIELEVRTLSLAYTVHVEVDNVAEGIEMQVPLDVEGGSLWL